MIRRTILLAILVAGCTKNPQGNKLTGEPCARASDCAGAACVLLGGGGGQVCSQTCVDSAGCPNGWSCEPAASGGRLCDCTPSPELCDGVDNDCNGLVDDNCVGGSDGGGGVDLAFSPDIALPAPSTNQIDILFVVDDSPSIGPMQSALISRFGDLLKVLDDAAAQGTKSSIHFGVVTTDLGAAQSTASSNCKPGGLGGKLQLLGRAHSAGCTPINDGNNFIIYDQTTLTNNLPVGQDLPTTFACMASAGDTGCGFEMPLEAAYQALAGSLPENQGFLRPGALLVVVFMTNEDDCSAPPTTDLFDLNKTATYGYELSYRCTNYGVMCGSPPMLMPYGDSGGALQMCQAATTAVGGKLFEASRYTNFFASVKPNPRSVLLASLAAPPTPVQSILGNPTTYQPCSGPPNGNTCAVLLEHSCNASATFFGDPAVRLSQVVESARNNYEASICQMDYTSSLQAIGNAIVAMRQGH